MNLKQILSTWLGLSLAFSAPAQPRGYDYQRILLDTKGPWCRVELPNDMFTKLGPQANHLRVLGTTPAGDTVEAAFVLHVLKETGRSSSSALTVRNQSSTTAGYFYTLEMKSPVTVNNLELAFGTDNFDWKIRLEGSTDEREWFTLVDDYRILSIQTPSTNFHFTQVVFPQASYPLFRILVKSPQDPKLTGVTISRVIHDDGVYRNHPARVIPAVKQVKGFTQLDVVLNQRVPVSRVQLYVRDTFDHYRPLEIRYAADSVQINNTWTGRYELASSGMISSLKNPQFDFSPVLTQRLALTIRNDNNEPLTIDSVGIGGPVYQLIIRIIRPADYVLVYGNRMTPLPHYDIENFPDRIPADIPIATLGPELPLGLINSEPILSKVWLWALMTLIIGVLGWFTVKMIRQPDGPGQQSDT